MNTLNSMDSQIIYENGCNKQLLKVFELEGIKYEFCDYATMMGMYRQDQDIDAIIRLNSSVVPISIKYRKKDNSNNPFYWDIFFEIYCSGNVGKQGSVYYSQAAYQIYCTPTHAYIIDIQPVDKIIRDMHTQLKYDIVKFKEDNIDKEKAVGHIVRTITINGIAFKNVHIALSKSTSIKNSRKCETIGICLRPNTINWIARAVFGINEVAKDFSYGSFADEMNRTLRDE